MVCLSRISRLNLYSPAQVSSSSESVKDKKRRKKKQKQKHKKCGKEKLKQKPKRKSKDRRATKALTFPTKLFSSTSCSNAAMSSKVDA